MELLSLLSDQSITIWGQTYNIYLNWIGKIIRWLIESVGSVGVGVILFSLALKGGEKLLQKIAVAGFHVHAVEACLHCQLRRMRVKRGERVKIRIRNDIFVRHRPSLLVYRISVCDHRADALSARMRQL